MVAAQHINAAMIKSLIMTAVASGHLGCRRSRANPVIGSRIPPPLLELRRTRCALDRLDYFAEADSAGLPKTLRQPSLKLARCLCMQAVIRSTSGISDEQRRKTSLVQSRR
jgi:hypothetical protein